MLRVITLLLFIAVLQPYLVGSLNCDRPSEPSECGPGEPLHESRWFFNYKTKTCQLGVWQGCLFTDREDCVRSCLFENEDHFEEWRMVSGQVADLLKSMTEGQRDRAFKEIKANLKGKRSKYLQN